jgi:type I restriction enzyme S subunit
MDLGTGATFKEVSKAVMERIAIPLPPLTEQKRIAAILNNVDALRRKREQTIAATEDLLGSTLREWFGDPMHNVRGYPSFELRELVRKGDKINYGIVQPGPDVPSGIPIVRVGDFGSLEINIGALKRVSPEVEAAYPRSRLVGDEVLISCVGSIGEIVLADERLAGMNIVRAVARVRCNEKMNRAYLAAYLRTAFVQRFFRRETRTVSQPTLNIRQIEQTPVIVPPITEQERFGAFFLATRRLGLEVRKSAFLLDDLFGSLSQRAFCGDL